MANEWFIPLAVIVLLLFIGLLGFKGSVVKKPTRRSFWGINILGLLVMFIGSVVLYKVSYVELIPLSIFVGWVFIVDALVFYRYWGKSSVSLSNK
jgi:hypothetical protein